MAELLIGAHTSAAGGSFNALLEGKRIGATTVQLFTSNQKQWQGRTITDDEVAKWEETLQETGLSHIMSHDSYLINLGSNKPDLLEKSQRAFQQEIERCHLLKITYMNFHPGIAVGSPPEECLDRIVDSLLSMEALINRGSTRLLLETTAGQGTTVGWKFEELRYIIDRVEKKIPIGVCIDTCHIFAAGYDLRTTDACDKTLTAFDDIVGLKHLYAFHLNDSLKDLGSRVDRHAALGEGKIGLDCFRYLMTDKRIRSLPKYLETPGGCPLWVDEIKLLKEMAEHAHTR
ncbi:MAG: deoxyribonuclease IV [Chlamydiia bacterium]|nr:deoxyribonuclease IV [Chlamydiia bacterium]